MLTFGYRRNFLCSTSKSIMPVMADGVILDFLEKIAWGFGATLAVLAVVALSIPGRGHVTRPSGHDHNSR